MATDPVERKRDAAVCSDGIGRAPDWLYHSYINKSFITFVSSVSSLKRTSSDDRLRAAGCPRLQFLE